MALPQDPQAAASMIDQMASSKMGVSPQMAQPAPAAPKDKDSAEDKASAKGSPQTEGDKMSAEAIVYEIDMGDGNKRPLTENQIKSTFQRYASLNHQNAQNGPINSLVAKIQKANPNATSKQIADKIDNMLKAGKSNPTLGNTKGERSGDAPENSSSLSDFRFCRPDARGLDAHEQLLLRGSRGLEPRGGGAWRSVTCLGVP